MRTSQMLAFVDSADAALATEHARLRREAFAVLRDTSGAESALPAPRKDPSAPPRADDPLAGLDAETRQHVLEDALEAMRLRRLGAENAQTNLTWERERVRRYRVEIHKKFTFAIAVFIFALVGAPLGLLFRRGGLAATGALAVGLFLFYWTTLAFGEKLADRGFAFVPPWLAMWLANLVVGALGLALFFGVLVKGRRR